MAVPTRFFAALRMTSARAGIGREVFWGQQIRATGIERDTARDRWSATRLPAINPVRAQRGGAKGTVPFLLTQKSRQSPGSRFPPKGGTTNDTLPTAKRQSFARSVLSETVGRWQVC
jgi:hypothetical protein